MLINRTMFHWVVCVSILYLRDINAALPDPAKFPSSLEDVVVPRNVTPECLTHASHWLAQLRLGVPWALHMMDSSTKLPSGILWGTNSVGNFDQCLAVSVQDDIATFTGHYCRMSMNLDISGHPLQLIDVEYAFCVPSTCTAEEIPFLMQDFIGPSLGIIIDDVVLDPINCYIKEPASSLSTGAIIFVVIVALLTFAVVLCAVIEWRQGEKTHPFVRACSLTSTCRALSATHKHPADISCLHGIRVGSTLWIILAHRYGNELTVPLSNPEIFVDYWANPWMMTIGNAFLSVDTFFLLSGMLMCTSFCRDVYRKGHFDLIKFYVYRYLRLAVSLGIVILFYITIMPLLGSGPIAHKFFDNESRNCKANWWLNMLFVNNYIYHEGYSMCVGQLWYTAVDMQLAWLSPLVLLPLYHSPRAGLQLMTLLILISCFIPFAVTYIFRFTMSSLQVVVERSLKGVPEGNQGLQIYYATQSRATPYLCGILFGYYLFKTKGAKIKLPQVIVFAGWLLSTAVALSVIFTLSIAHQPDYVYDLVGSAFYAGFHRLGWSASILWIIFACINGYGGIVDKILSWNMLLPLSRLTYSIYLVQFIVIIYDNGNSKTLTQYNDYDTVHDFFSDLLPVIVLSILLYVLVEGPVLTLLRILFSKGKQPSKKESKSLTKDKIEKITEEETTNNTNTIQ